MRFACRLLCGTILLLFTIWAGALGGEALPITGTAFVVNKDGYLLTCAHVVKDAGRVRVTVGPNTYDAAVLAVDENLDLAVLQVKATDLSVLPLANSDAAEVGEDVRAFGFPLAPLLGKDITVTKGTISGIPTLGARKFLQIDAAVNPGNSGGPLVNERGQVIGVINAKVTDPRVSNVGFAVPINYAKQLLTSQRVKFGEQGAKEKLEGTALVNRVSPAVALVSVWKKWPAEVVFDLGGGVKLRMVLIRPGFFMMGSEKGDGREKPGHKVTLRKPFYIGKYQVTQEQWQAVMGANPSIFKNNPKGPVNSVSWNACQDFVKQLSAKLGGRKFSLPSEAEWEYACRAGSATEDWFGDDEARLAEHARYDKNSAKTTHPVGRKKPIFGTPGMWEWCEDVWHASYEGAPADGSAWLEGGDQRLRVVRDSSWDDPSLARPLPLPLGEPRYGYSPRLAFFGGGVRVCLRDF